MNRIILVVLIIAAAGAWYSSNSQVKIAFVDSDVIIGQLPETKDVLAKLEDQKKLYLDTINARDAEIKTKADAFTAKYEDAQKQMEAGKLTADQIKALEAELGQMREEVQNMDQELAAYKQNVQNLLLQAKDELFKPVREKITKTIEELAKELKYNLVLDKASSAVLYGDKEIDITFKVLDKLKIINPILMKSTLIAVFALLLISVTLLSQQKIGYVDSKVILETLQDAKDAQLNLDNIVTKWKTELVGLNDSLALLKDDFEKKKLILTEKVRQQKEEEITEMEKRITDFRQMKFGESGEYFQKQNELMKPVQDRVFKAIQDVAKEGGYDFVFDRSSQIMLLYMNDKYDLTQKVVKKLEAQ